MSALELFILRIRRLEQEQKHATIFLINSILFDDNYPVCIHWELTTSSHRSLMTHFTKIFIVTTVVHHNCMMEIGETYILI